MICACYHSKQVSYIIERKPLVPYFLRILRRVSRCSYAHRARGDGSSSPSPRTSPHYLSPSTTLSPTRYQPPPPSYHEFALKTSTDDSVSGTVHQTLGPRHLALSITSTHQPYRPLHSNYHTYPASLRPLDRKRSQALGLASSTVGPPHPTRHLENAAQPPQRHHPLLRTNRLHPRPMHSRTLDLK
jgi:hypothetical protein